MRTHGRNGCAYYCVVRRESLIYVRQQGQVGEYAVLFKTFRRNVAYLWSSTGVKIEEQKFR
ncbi:MAG: hypothetical protein LBC20_12100 [Planctomycetaceae bacterium]|nr:hypothetical protein [Planctomycetaceae bacterium]